MKKSQIDEIWFVVIVLTLMYAVACPKMAEAEEIYPEKEWVWGCQIKGRTLDGSCVLKRFTKVGETENDVDTDEPKVVGFEPGNIPISKDGKPIWSRIPAKTFMEPGSVRLTSGAKCACSRK